MTPDDALASLVETAYSATPTVQAADDVRASVSVVGGEFVVAIPGTTDLSGWLCDLSSWPADLPMLGTVHEGFGRAALKLWPLLASIVSVRGVRTVYAGHSLGGAMAQCLAVLHMASGFSPCRVVSFGSPRVATAFNAKFRGAVKTSLQWSLYARAGDPVPGVPLPPLYMHAAKLSPLGEPLGGLDVVANHMMARYAADLRAIAVAAQAVPVPA